MVQALRISTETKTKRERERQRERESERASERGREGGREGDRETERERDRERERDTHTKRERGELMTLTEISTVPVDNKCTFPACTQLVRLGRISRCHIAEVDGTNGKICPKIGLIRKLHVGACRVRKESSRDSPLSSDAIVAGVARMRLRIIEGPVLNCITCPMN